ncbi:MAG: GntR family transcriptional regulator [Erysipelotrichaceae bacterium]|nr:GntR family transcriptional regulator [Erysipelotrichaceae bacterium]
MNKIPKYVEIINYYEENIRNGNLKPGDKIDKEIAICKTFNASRMTVNKAMTFLSQNGYIYRISGYGSFVTDDYLNRVAARSKHPSGITDMIEKGGMKAGTELLEYGIVKGKKNPKVAKMLEIGEDDYMHYFKRLRTGDGEPIVISYSYIVYDMLPDFDVKCLDGSFNYYMDKVKHIKRTYGSSQASAVLPDDEQKILFKNRNIALLKQELFWYVDGRPFEVTYHYFAGDKFAVSEEVNLVDDNGKADYQVVTKVERVFNSEQEQ